MPAFNRRRQHDDLARAPRRQRKTQRRGADIRQRFQFGAKPSDLDAQPRAMQFIGVLRPKGARKQRAPETSAGHASASARASANKTGRVASETVVSASRTTWRQASTTSAPEASSASTSSSRRGCSSPGAIRRAAGALRTMAVLSTSAVSAGMPAWRAARSASASALRACLIRKRRIAIPATASSWVARNAGGKDVASNFVSARSASSRRPVKRKRRTSRCRAWAAFARSPRRSSAARAVSSAFAEKLKSRDTSAISASATTQRARANTSFGPKARAASKERLCANKIAELRHGDAAQRQRRRVVAQSDELQCAERIARREGVSRGTDQQVHRNPARLVTPVAATSGIKSIARSMYGLENGHARHSA